MQRLPHVLSRAEPSGLSCIVALLQGMGGEGLKVLILSFLDQEHSVVCQGTAELAGGPSCWVLLLLPPLSGFPPVPSNCRR